jgi:hypothetical protein
MAGLPDTPMLQRAVFLEPAPDEIPAYQAGFGVSEAEWHALVSLGSMNLRTRTARALMTRYPGLTADGCAAADRVFSVHYGPPYPLPPSRYLPDTLHGLRDRLTGDANSEQLVVDMQALPGEADRMLAMVFPQVAMIASAGSRLTITDRLLRAVTRAALPCVRSAPPAWWWAPCSVYEQLYAGPNPPIMRYPGQCDILAALAPSYWPVGAVDIYRLGHAPPEMLLHPALTPELLGAYLAQPDLPSRRYVSDVLAYHPGLAGDQSEAWREVMVTSMAGSSNPTWAAFALELLAARPGRYRGTPR